MSTIKTLLSRADKLERQRKVHICFEMVEEYWPGDEHFGECDIAFKRNSQVLLRFPKKLPIEEWQAKFNPNHN